MTAGPDAKARSWARRPCQADRAHTHNAGWLRRNQRRTQSEAGPPTLFESDWSSWHVRQAVIRDAFLRHPEE